MTVSTLKAFLPNPVQNLPGISPPGPGDSDSFANALGGAIGSVEAAGAAAKTAASDLLTGGRGDVHTVAIISQRAGLTLDLFQQVRNKFVQAYQEIMKMPM
ncbi:MAG: flagellar hook-basal body complex protein FliE [Terriglobia bacterium]